MPASPSGTVAIERIIALLMPLAISDGSEELEFATVSNDHITITTVAKRHAAAKKSKMDPAMIIQRVDRVGDVVSVAVLAS